MSHNNSTIWVVVLVESGIPVRAEAYRDPKTALKREKALRRKMRQDYDEVGVFEVEIGVQEED